LLGRRLQGDVDRLGDGELIDLDLPLGSQIALLLDEHPPVAAGEPEHGPFAVLVGSDRLGAVGLGVDLAVPLAQGDGGALDGLAALVLDLTLDPPLAGPGLAPDGDAGDQQEDHRKYNQFGAARKHDRVSFLVSHPGMQTACAASVFRTAGKKNRRGSPPGGELIQLECDRFTGS
jgi:hypothetical protein